MIIVCLLLCLLLLLSFLVYASYSIQSGIYLRSFCKKHTAEKIVALTFDDGPDSLQTPKVLQVLKEYQVTACFFCIGHKVKGNEAILQKAGIAYKKLHLWGMPFSSLAGNPSELLLTYL